MSRATPDDQLKFLLSCVKYSNNGKIDFVEVARDCHIVSKGAAAKRYERLMRANGIHHGSGSSERSSPPVSTPKRKPDSGAAKAAAAKRRKIEDDSMNNEKGFRRPFYNMPKPEPNVSTRIKPEPNTLPMIKKETQHTFNTESLPQMDARRIQYFQPHKHPMTLQRTPNYVLSNQAPHFSGQQFPMHGQVPRQMTVQHYNPMPQARSETPSLSPYQGGVPTEQSEPFKVDEKASIIFDEFCNSDIFSQPAIQSATPANHPVTEATSAVTTSVKLENASEKPLDTVRSQQSIVILD